MPKNQPDRLPVVNKPATPRPAFMDKPTGPTLEQRTEALEKTLNKFEAKNLAANLAFIVKRDTEIEAAREASENAAGDDAGNDGGAAA